VNATDTTNLAVTLPNISLANAGSYNIVLSNNWGSITSSPVSLNVQSPLSFSTDLKGITNYTGKNIALTVSVSGGSPISYQWFKGSSILADGGTLHGTATNVLSITPAATTDSGLYQVIATSGGSSATSTIATVSILSVPAVGLSIVSNKITMTGSNAIPGSNYVIWTSPSLLTGPWTPLLTNPAPFNGIISFTDANSVSGTSQKYYRIQFP
jgi:hypothetical protein